MKNFIFAGLFFATFLLCKADYSDYYRVYYQGRELENGETIVCDNAYDEILNDEVVKMFDADINVINQLPMPGLNRATILFTDTPTKEEWQKNESAWGKPKLCYYGGDANGEMASCMGSTGLVKIPDNSYDCFNWQFQVQYSPVGVRSVYTLELKAATGEIQWENYSYIPDTEFYVTVIFQTDNAGIENLSDENDSKVEFYSLDGRKINNPGKGFYIEKRGSKTLKVLKK